MSAASATGIAIPARAAAVIGIVWIAGYVLVLDRQGSGIASRSVFYAAFVGTMAIFCVTGSTWRMPDRFARPVLAAATAGYLMAGFLALMSIGLPLLAAAMLAMAAAINRGIRSPAVAVAAALTVVVFLIGIQLT